MIEMTCTDSTWCDVRMNRDAHLIAGIKAGDERAFETLVRLHGAKMLAVARRFVQCEQDAHDAYQEALIIVFRRVETFEEHSKLSTWLYRITVNACLMQLRSERRRNEVKIDDLLPASDRSAPYAQRVVAWEKEPAARAEAAETRERVRECIDQLPQVYRRVLQLRDIEQLETEQVAQTLGCSINCIKTRLHRARQALRALLHPIVNPGHS